MLFNVLPQSIMHVETQTWLIDSYKGIEKVCISYNPTFNHPPNMLSPSKLPPLNIHYICMLGLLSSYTISTNKSFHLEWDGFYGLFMEDYELDQNLCSITYLVWQMFQEIGSSLDFCFENNHVASRIREHINFELFFMLAHVNLCELWLWEII
jgi:hypothetical protein